MKTHEVLFFCSLIFLIVGVVLLWHGYTMTVPEPSIAPKIESLDGEKVNHLLEELSAQERQLSALERDVQEILVELTKLRKGKK